MTMLAVGRPTRPTESAEPAAALPEGRGLLQDEPLIFELGGWDKTGVDFDPTLDDLAADELAGLTRATPPALPGLSEPEAVRHYVRLSQKNHAIDLALYPLGSCTMKHNPRLGEKMARLAGFADIHPLQPQATVPGALALMGELARWLTVLTGMPAVALSPKAGAQGELCGLLAIRSAHEARGDARKRVLVSFQNAFHGRTLATLAATGNEKYLAGFGPKVDGFDQVPFNNLNAVRDANGPHTAGIMVEPVQGEGGIRTASADFLRGLRAACDEFGLFLGLDEVQSGMGRSGRLFAFEGSGIVPDVVTTAKGLGGGFPIGAILAREHVAKYLVAGSHGTTFGGNPLACTAANAVLDILLAPGFLDEVVRKGEVLGAALARLVADFPTVFAGVRGGGLIQGLHCVVPAGEVQAVFVAEGLLTVTAGENVLRLVPPLVVTDADIAEAVARMRRGAGRLLHSASPVAAP